MLKRQFVIFGLAEWSAALPTNQHHLARQLTRRGHDVLFVDTVGTRKPRLNLPDALRMIRRLRFRERGLSKVESGIWRISPPILPPGVNFARESFQARFSERIRKAIGELGWERPIGWFFNPRASFAVDSIDFSTVALHLVDDLRQIPGADVAEIEKGEKLLADRAEFILTSAPALYNRMKALHPGKTHFFRNVVDYDHFSRQFSADAMQEIQRPRIVFSGNLAESKIDFTLLEQMIDSHSGWQWVFIGPKWEGESAGALTRVARHSNVHLLGHVSYEDLPAYLSAADVLIIPYQINKLTESVCPLKFFEYLATGKPVVTTPLPALQEFASIVPTPSTAEAFASAIDALLKNDDVQSREKRLSLAREYTWNRRIDEIETLLNAAENA